MSLGEVVREYRKSQGLSLREFGQLCGISHAYISDIENGSDRRTGKMPRPTVETVTAIAKGMGISLGELMARAGYEQGAPLSIPTTAYADTELQQIMPELAHAVAKLRSEEQASLLSLLTISSDAKQLSAKRLLDIAADNPDLTADDLRAFIRVIAKAIASSPASPYPPASPSK